MITWWLWAVGCFMTLMSTTGAMKPLVEKGDRESLGAIIAWLIFCAAWPVAVPVALIAGAIKGR